MNRGASRQARAVAGLMLVSSALFALGALIVIGVMARDLMDVVTVPGRWKGMVRP